MTVKGLAHRLKLDSGTLTPLLKRLESAGLMTRRRSLEDERIVNIFLTSEEGQTLEHEVAQMQYEVACQTELLPTEFVELRDTLCRLIETMTESQQAATAIA